MALTTTTHINFDGNAREALEFYADVFGGEVMMMTYGMMGSADAVNDPERVIFGQVSTDNGFRVMAYDVELEREYAPGKHPFYVSVRADSDDEAHAIWNRLVDGATIITPYGPSQWSEGYGMATDKFGVTWFVDVTPAG